MEVLDRMPFVRFLMALTVGVGLGCALAPTWSLYLAAWGVLTVVLAVFITIRCMTGLREQRYYGLLGVLVLLAWSSVGLLLTWQSDPAIDRKHFSHFRSDALVGVIADEPVMRGSHVRFPFAVTQAYGNNGVIGVSGRLMLTVRVADSLVDEAADVFHYGDELLIPADYEPVPPPYNPSELDYRSYLAGRDIWHQDYLAFGELKKVGRGKGNALVSLALALRQRMVAKFAVYIPDRDAFSVASALILGYRAEMDDRLMQAFSATGTIHVLSVSGMHVVIVFWLLTALLGWMDRGTVLRVVKFMLLLLAVWGYALLTGFSPPVLRASIMMSFVMAATVFGQQNRVYNSIAASAFFLLLYQPKFLLNIGFQLSYLAVLGIVFLHPVMQLVFRSGNRLVQPITGYMGMSIGAQAGAGPLAAYHFHQFPLYFLPANLFVVLPTSMMMYIGFALLFLPGGQLAAWAGVALAELILVTLRVLSYIEQLPNASIRGIELTWWQPLFLYTSVVAIAMVITTRHKRWVYVTLVVMAVWGGTSFATLFNDKDRQVIVFNVRRHLAVAFIDQGRVWLYTDLPSIDDRTIGYSVLPALEAHTSQDAIRFMPYDSLYRDRQVYAKGGVLQYGTTRFVVYDGAKRYGGRLRADVVILRNNPTGPLSALRDVVDCRQLVLDGSNYDSTIAYWKAEAKAASVPLYVLKDNFAYVWPLEPPVP